MTRLVIVTTLAAGWLLTAPPSALGAWTWPLEGEVLTLYRNGDDPYAAGQHRGIDIAGRTGDPVVAAVPGLVRFSGIAGSSGLTVSVRSADGRFDLSYLHLSSIAVHRGDSVAAGAPIGAVGTTGVRSLERPHLHFGVREAGSRHAYVDPLALLPPPETVAPRPPEPVPAPAPRPAGPHEVPAPVRLARPLPSPRPETPSLPSLGPAPAPAVHPFGPRRHPGSAAPAAAPHPVAAAAPRSTAARHVTGGGLAAAQRLGPAPRDSQLAAREAGRSAHPGGAGVDLGWIAACVGLLGTALALSARQGRRPDRAKPALIARIAAVVPALGPRGLRTRE